MQNAGTPMFVVDDAAIRTGRDNLTGAEVAFMLQREADEFLKFLRCEELVENHALRRQDRTAARRPLQLVSEMTVVRIKLGGCGSRAAL